MEIDNIQGTEEHLGYIKDLASRLGKNVRYLFLSFDGEPGTPEMAQLYVDTLREFNSIDTLRIEVNNDGGATQIFNLMNADVNFPWFEKVRILKSYQISNMQDKTVMNKFFTMFKNLDELRGIIEEEFNPFEAFQEQGKHIKKLSWTLPENATMREKVISFLNYNDTQYLRLVGGAIDKFEVDTVH